MTKDKTDRTESDLRTRLRQAMILNAVLDWRGGVVRQAENEQVVSIVCHWLRQC